MSDPLSYDVAVIKEIILSHDVAVIWWITSCNKNRDDHTCNNIYARTRNDIDNVRVGVFLLK